MTKIKKPKSKKEQGIKAFDLKPCDPGYTRDSNGVCQKDPLPPDPTHPPK